MLVGLGIVDAAPTPAVENRIRLLNTVRNTLTHGGEPPTLNGMDAEQSMRHTMAIVSGVVPQIVVTALGRVLGFKKGSAGSLSQNTRDLEQFFQNAKWRDWPLDELAFEDWFYGELAGVEDGED
jgi:hypothetical protein